MSAEETEIPAPQWPVLKLPNELEVIENLVTLADPVKEVEEQAKKFFKMDGKEEVSTIESDEDFDRACNFALDCNTVEKRLDTRRKAIVDEPNKFVKRVNGVINPYIDRINTVRVKVTTAARLYKAKKDAAQQKKDAEERAAREKEALDRAQRLQDSGHTEAANQLLDIAASAPKPVTTKRTVSGGSAFDTTRWVGEIADKKALLQAAIEGRIPLDKIEISQAYLNERARELKKEMVVDGIKITQSNNLGLRRS